MSWTKSTYRIIALMMAFLMLFTSTSFAMDMHYCGGELKSVSFFGKAKTCHDLAAEFEKSTKSCPHHKKMVTKNEGCSEDKDCCSNKTVILQFEQDQKTQYVHYVVNKELKQFVIAYVSAFLSDRYDNKGHAANYILYRPPIIQEDIQVLYQTFLL